LATKYLTQILRT